MKRPSPAEGNRGEAEFRQRGMPRLVSILLTVTFILTGCSSGPETTAEKVGEAEAGSTSTTPADVLDEDTPTAASVGLDDGYRFPSELSGRWLDGEGMPVADGLVRDGEPPRLTLQVSFGPDHCDWDEIVLLDLAWPLGSEVTTHSEDTVRQYARDVDGTLGEWLQTTFADDMEAPEDAVDTGYHRQGSHLLVGPTSADTAVFVERPDGTVERWPRVVPSAICL